MNFEGLEKRINKRWKTITYWKDGVLVGRKCTKCGEDKEIGEFCFLNKEQNIYDSICKECKKEYNKEYRENNFDKVKKGKEKWRKNNPEYYKRYRKDNEEKIKERGRQYYKDNKEKIQQRSKQHKEENEEYYKKYLKKYRVVNKEYYKEYSKQYYQNNKEHIKEYHKQYDKQQNEIKRNNNIIEITNMLHQLNPLLRKLNIKAYGIIYKITNIKTGKCYIGQTIQPSLKERYKGGIIKGWINERKCYENQKFTEELIEKDFKAEVINYGICRYHLDKLEAYYIDKYNSCENGYNNQTGNHNSNDGIEEFNKILKENNLEFIDDKLIKIV